MAQREAPATSNLEEAWTRGLGKGHDSTHAPLSGVIQGKELWMAVKVFPSFITQLEAGSGGV